jgi:hypothetical protein
MALEYLLREQDILFLILTMNKFCKALNDVRTQSRLSLWQLIDELETIDFGFDLSSSVSLLHQVRFHILPIAFSPLVAAMLKKTE